MVELRLGVPAPLLHLPFHYGVVRAVNVVVEGGADLFDAEGGEEAVVDPLLKNLRKNSYQSRPQDSDERIPYSLLP